MSLNRYRMNGKMKLVIRYTADGKPWLSKLTRAELGYCAAHAAGVTGVVVHTMLVLDDMCILVVTDTAGLLSFCTQRLHTCLTELSNAANCRVRGTIWDNRKPREAFIEGWLPLLYVISLLAVRAAAAAGTDDPYDWPGYFGPRMWGTYERIERPRRLGRSTRPKHVWLRLKAPDCAPRTYLEDLIAEAEHTTEAWVASVHGGRDIATLPCPHLTLDRIPEVIADEDALELLTEELRLWRAYYRRCRDEFKEDQLTVFPAGTDRFRALGAAVDPCPTYVAPPPPRRRFPPRPPPA